MLGMILCGGVGKRFRPITETIPKPLFELKDDYTLLDRQLFQYKSAGFDRVILLTAHLGEKIRKRFGSKHMGLKIEYVREKKPLGTLNAIRLGMEVARQDAMVSNGDIVTDLNLKRMREEFERSPHQASIFITRLRSPYGIVGLGGRRIKSFVEKPLLDYFINGGFYCLSKRVLRVLEKFKVGNIEHTAFPELANRGQLGFYREEGDPFWMSIDTSKDLEAVEREYSNRTDKPWGHEKIIKLGKKKMEKLLYLMAGYRTSFHYHKVRDETLHVLAGAGRVEFKGGKRKRFTKGSKIHIKPNTTHSFIATKNALLREVSTPHPKDVVRVKDFYEVR